MEPRHQNLGRIFNDSLDLLRLWEITDHGHMGRCDAASVLPSVPSTPAGEAIDAVIYADKGGLRTQARWQIAKAGKDFSNG